MKISSVLLKEGTKISLGQIMLQTEREITIQAPWGKLRGLTWGTEGALPVFLCQGRMDACSGFRPLVRRLPDCFYYVAVDLPGNGKSDHFPRGVQLTVMDFVPTVKVVREHFKWDKFIYVGHSLGALMGKFFNIAYPGHITRMVELDPLPSRERSSPDPESMRRWYHLHYHGYYSEEQYKKLNGASGSPKYTYDKYFNIAYPGFISRMVELDPIPAHESRSPDPDGVRRWYHLHYHGYYSEEQYKKLNGTSEPPKYTYDKALEMVMKNRRLPKEAAEYILERGLSPAGDGLYRFTHDQRQKTFTRLPLSGEAYRSIYTASHTPTLCILAQGSIDDREYENTPFVMEPASWPNGNYRVKIVEGGHDVHISNPERMAEDISKFLLEGVKTAKL